MNRERVCALARACGFDLAGITGAEPASDAARFERWRQAGLAGEMRYLTDRRAEVRQDPRNLLASAKSILCVGKLYNGPEPHTAEWDESGRTWISRYAWGGDYHDILRRDLEKLAAEMRRETDFDYRICVDTAPLLERSYARLAGLGWIGRNTCLINQRQGSWFFLGELLLSLELEPDAPPPDRCGSCLRCIDACPTGAIVPFEGGWTVDARLCISYFTIELRTAIPETLREGMGKHVFGCDICQDVCPWNRRAPVTRDPAFAPAHFAPPLAEMAALTEERFRAMFRGSPIKRSRYAGFLRNVAVAMGNSGSERFRGALERLAQLPDALVSEHARWALDRLNGNERSTCATIHARQ